MFRVLFLVNGDRRNSSVKENRTRIKFTKVRTPCMQKISVYLSNKYFITSE